MGGDTGDMEVEAAFEVGAGVSEGVHANGATARGDSVSEGECVSAGGFFVSEVVEEADIHSIALFDLLAENVLGICHRLVDGKPEVSSEFAGCDEDQDLGEVGGVKDNGLGDIADEVIVFVVEGIAFGVFVVAESEGREVNGRVGHGTLRNAR